MSERDTIFISHSTPQDNEFSIWIASRLELLGYKVWVDKNGLLGGERFWPTIQKAIDRSIKILFVYSKNILNSDGVLKPGIENELEYGKSIAIQNGLSDFIIPLHIDDSQYHLAIGMPNINHIPFTDNWAVGLKQLLRKLEKDEVPKNKELNSSSFSEWYENEYSSNISIKYNKRLYYSSWWGFRTLPQIFYIFRFHSSEQAKLVRDLNQSIPINLNNNLITSFEPNLMMKIEGREDFFDNDITPDNVFVCNIKDLYYHGAFSNSFPTYNDSINAFKRLMMSVWNSFLRKKGLFKYEFSGRRLAYYKPQISNNKNEIRFVYPFSNGKRKKRKSLLGKYKSLLWHYAISANVLIDPFFCYLVKSHLVFTSDGKTPISDERKMHTYRRDKAKMFFNEEWRDLFLAMIQSLKDQDGKIIFPVTYDNDYIEFKEWPELFWSDFDYHDPNIPMSIDCISDYVEDSEILMSNDN